ncbi:cytochrome P450 2C31-like [Oppia nitens]|uniref:cytochrome P450 2C31-like n=1 Tax=Oppia nitens TaxID=1686743 RepID=UPI0023DA9101|nr:cytochrome P450 2C31-like [Oppia nitens]
MIYSDILISIILFYIVYKVAKFYQRYYSLPPGPFPIPILGNILSFKSKLHWIEVYRQLSQKYGSVFTLHMYNTPIVVITDADIAREAFNKNEFSGRPESYFGSLFKTDKYTDIGFADYGQTWEALRRVSHAAVQKYSTNDHLLDVIVDSVDNTLKTMLEKEGPDKPIKPFDYIYLMFLNILANSTFGENYSITDSEFNYFKYVLLDFDKEIEYRWVLWEFSPLIRLFDYKLVDKHRKLFDDLRLLMINKFRQHYIDYEPSIERDICDALITAKNDALREAKESAPHLTDDNLVMTLIDLFYAGTDTSQNTFQWILLLMSYYPLMQTKLRQEIESKIGDRLARHEDRQRCHYVMAFIAETLRFRNVFPSGLMHKAVVDSKIGNHMIPKDTSVLTFQAIILRNNDNKYWTNGLDFIPERFLDSDGHYMTTHSPAFIPFGVGRRVCLGEKLAIADLFLVLVRFLQSTQNYDIVLDTYSDLDPNPNDLISCRPNDYTIILKSKI